MAQQSYVPAPGDVVWLDFSPQVGREQSGHRPAVILSPAGYNDRTSLALCCPMTTKIKGYPFEVVIAGAPASAVLVDHAKSQDWRARRAVFRSRVSSQELAEVRAKLAALIGTP